MALVFDSRGLLPEGVHGASLEEVEQLFGGFRKTDRRIKLFRKLRDYLIKVKKAGCGKSVVLDGSFVMACVDEPEDIDMILVLPPSWDADAELKPYQYNLVSKRRVRREYGFDMIAVSPGSVDQQDWTTFFGRVNVKWCEQFGWPDRSTKGIVEVTL